MKDRITVFIKNNLFGIIIFTLGISYALFYVYQRETNLVKTKGVVTKVNHISGTVDYMFVVNGQEYESFFLIRSPMDDIEISIGDSICVEYNRVNPSNSEYCDHY